MLSSIEVDEIEYEYSEHKGQYEGKFRFHIELTNLGEFPIYVKEVSTNLGWGILWLIKVGTEDEYERRGFLVPPNVSVQRMFECSSPIPIEGEEATNASFTCSFQYGPTAKKMYVLEPAISIISYDADHVLEGEMHVKNDGEVYTKHLNIGENLNRRERSSEDEW